jgi:hypothetical protein
MNLIECDAELPKKVRECHASLQKRVDKLQADRGALEERANAMQNAPLTPQLVGELDALRTARIVSWQTELDIRTAYAEWLEGHLPALYEVIAKTSDRLTKFADELTEKLVAIGYVQADPSSQVIGKIEPGMIHRHPQYATIRNRLRALEDFVNSVATVETSRNKSAMQQTTSDMQAFRDKVSGASLVFA